MVVGGGRPTTFFCEHREAARWGVVGEVDGIEFCNYSTMHGKNMGIEVLDRAHQDLRHESKIILIGLFSAELLMKKNISNRPGALNCES